MPPKKTLPGFDEAKLAELAPPITVQVEKIIGARPHPISLPIKPGEEFPGKGLDHDEVRQLNLVLGELVGGGEYHNTATGANGVQMRWMAYFPPDRYPDRPVTVTAADGGNSHAAPALGAAPAQVPQVAYPPPQPAMAPPPQYMSPVQTWMQTPRGAAPVYAPQPGYYSQPWAQQAPWASPSPYSAFGSPPYRGDDDRLQQAREETLKLAAQMERERLESAHKEQIAALTAEMRRVQEMIQRRPQESEETTALKAEIAALRQGSDKAEIMTMIREMGAQTQRQIEAVMQLVNQRPQGPDPGISLLVESQKAQAASQLEAARMAADAQKEIARLQAETQKEATRSAIGPREMLDLANRFNQGHDALANGWARIIQAQQSAFENMMNAQGAPTHPALDMAAQGLQGVLGSVSRYLEIKEQQQTQQAQLAQMAISARAQGAQPATPQLQGAAPPAAAAGGDEEGDDEGEEDELQEEMDQHEKDLFGVALPEVRNLRMSVQQGKLSPEQAAQALLMGIDHFKSRGAKIKAFLLYQQGELAKLVDILLPGAATSFREQMLQAISVMSHGRDPRSVATQPSA